MPRRAALFSDVTVILGDPRLPDPVKRDGRFNEEDIETVERLKTALRELPDYRFRFLDNHASLFADLRAQPAAFRAEFLRRGLQQRRLHGNACAGAAGDARHSLQRRRTQSVGVCYNKSLVRGIAQAIDVPVPAETYFNSDDLAATIPSVVSRR